MALLIPLLHRSTIVWRGSRRALNCSPIMPRDASLLIWERTNAFQKGIHFQDMFPIEYIDIFFLLITQKSICLFRTNLVQWTSKTLVYTKVQCMYVGTIYIYDVYQYTLRYNVSKCISVYTKVHCMYVGTIYV